MPEIHKQCEWCRVTLSLGESNKVRSKTNPCTNETTNYTLCDYCNTFPSKESMEYYKGILVDWASLNVPIRLDSISSVCLANDWKVTLNITVKYGSELIPVRIGWIA